jgi:hypothetical protein
MWTGLLIAAIIGGYYWYSIWRRPYRKCWRCHGSKANMSTNLWRGAFGRCHVCGGSGQRVRWGVRVLTPKVYQEIKSGRKGRNY